jgi:hypothetical protein
MTDKGMFKTVRGTVLGLACVSIAAMLAGCGHGMVRGGTNLTAKPSKADFDITIDATDPADKQIVVEPNEGDAWLEAVPSPGADDNRIVWKSSVSFSIKFVSIDDQSKDPKKGIGNEQNGWNNAVRDSSGYKYRLKLDDGKGNKKKTIRGVKYLVKSPAGCDDTNPGPNCVVLDPVIIVRY